MIGRYELAYRGTQKEGIHIKQHLSYNAGFVRWEEERVMLECKGRGCHRETERGMQKERRESGEKQSKTAAKS